MKYIFKLQILVVIGLLATCQHDPYAHLYTTEKPKEKDLPGVYYLVYQTVSDTLEALLDTAGQEQLLPQIELAEDGKFITSYLPTFHGLEPQFEGLKSDSGVWELSVVGSIQSKKDPKDHWGLELKGLDIDMKNPGLISNRKPYQIIFGFGDPDAGLVMVFARNFSERKPPKRKINS